MRSLLRTRQVQTMLPSVLGGYLHLALTTTSWTLDGKEHLAAYSDGRPGIFAFWHEFLPLMPAVLMVARSFPSYRPIPVHTLVSQHRDGRVIGAVVKRFGIMPILGSSTRGGAAAMRNLLGVLRDGCLIGITPDGPKGPAHQLAPGVAHLAALSGVPIVPCAARSRRSVRLNTWDKMPIPLPFGTGVVVCGAPLTIDRGQWRDSLSAITQALNQVAARADSLCPS